SGANPRPVHDRGRSPPGRDGGGSRGWRRPPRLERSNAPQPGAPERPSKRGRGDDAGLGAGYGSPEAAGTARAPAGQPALRRRLAEAALAAVILVPLLPAGPARAAEYAMSTEVHYLVDPSAGQVAVS